MLAVNENLQLIAIAFENGTVLLQRGDATKDKGLKNKVYIFLCVEAPTLANRVLVLKMLEKKRHNKL